MPDSINTDVAISKYMRSFANSISFLIRMTLPSHDDQNLSPKRSKNGPLPAGCGIAKRAKCSGSFVGVSLRDTPTNSPYALGAFCSAASLGGDRFWTVDSDNKN